MSKWFKSPSIPAPAPPPPVEATPPPTRVDAQVLQTEERERIRRKRGRASTILTGGSQGDTAAPMTAAATLLGR